MPNPSMVDFYFDFSSPYSYLGAHLIEPVLRRHGRAIAWRPVLLGAAFKVSGQQPLTEIPVKGDYSRRDFARSARFHGLPYRHPSTFPIVTANTARAVLVVQQLAPERTGDFVRRAFDAFFVEDRPINEPAVVGQLAAGLGLDAAAIEAAIRDPAVKDRLKAEVDRAVERGVFGAPMTFVDGEAFWGHDRIDQIERWLATGPF